MTEFHIVYGTLDGTTTGVPHYSNEFGPRDFGCEFETAEYVVVQYVAGDPRDEKIAETLVEEHFGGMTGVEATEDHRKGY